MSEGTKISWCDDTCNFYSGCTEVGPGCVNCYARELAKRFSTFGGWGKGAPRRLHESAFKLAHKLNRKPWICDGCGKAWPISPYGRLAVCPDCGEFVHRRRIFSLSLGDWLDPEVPAVWLARMLDTVRQCDQVVWLLCTKRPELFSTRLAEVLADNLHFIETRDLWNWTDRWITGNPPKNIITLTSVENQATADERIPHALRIPSAFRGLSVEPLLGPITLHCAHGFCGCDTPKISFFIVGGESGPKARPCDTAWIRSLIAQGQAAGVATFCKQLGAFNVEQEGSQRRRVLHDDPKGGDMEEWPADLRIRQWPEGL